MTISPSPFERETGVKIPVEANDPKRFTRRADWLLDNAKKEWTDWRCEKSRNSPLDPHRLKATRPELELIMYPYDSFIIPGLMKTGRRPGFDLRLPARLA